MSDEESAIFDAAVDGYPMLNAKAVSVAARTRPDGTEYRFIAQDQPREAGPDAPPFSPREMTVYVTVEEGEMPVFTQVVR